MFRVIDVSTKVMLTNLTIAGYTGRVWALVPAAVGDEEAGVFTNAVFDGEGIAGRREGLLGGWGSAEYVNQDAGRPPWAPHLYTASATSNSTLIAFCHI